MFGLRVDGCDGAAGAQGYRRFRCRQCRRQFNDRSTSQLNRTQYLSDVVAPLSFGAFATS
jgi:hypothetical protein